MIVPSPDDLINLHHITTLAPVHEQIVSEASNWMADAAAAAAADPEDIGLWERYIQLYKNGLAFVHDNIVDEPLRKMGFEQTWGPSIFLFTAGELVWWLEHYTERVNLSLTTDDASLQISFQCRC